MSVGILLLVAACTSDKPGNAPPAAVPSGDSRATASPSTSTAPSTRASSAARPPTSFRRSAVLGGHSGAVTRVVWSPDGTLLASAAGATSSRDTTVRLWRRDGHLVAVLRGHRCGVRSLAWSPDGRTLASGSCDATVRWWRRDGTPERTITPGAGAVLALAWSPDGRTLATGSVAGPANNTVRLWDATTGARRATMAGGLSGGKFYNLGWSRDGRFLAGGAVDYHEWLASGTSVFSSPGCASCTPSWGFGWAPDGRVWAVGDESGGVEVYRTDGRRLGSAGNDFGNADVIAWSPDGVTFAGGNVLFRLDGERVRVQAALLATEPPSPRAVAVAWSPSGVAVAAGFAHAPGVYVYAADARPIAMLSGHRGDVDAIAWSPDGSMIASASADTTVRLWSVAPTR